MDANLQKAIARIQGKLVQIAEKLVDAEEGVVFMSDLLFAGFHPYLGDGNPDRWLEVLLSILDGTTGIENASRFVPGHGPVATKDDVRRLADYIQDCMDIARRLGENETPDVASQPIPEKYANWGLPRFFPANINFLLKGVSKRT